MSDESGISSFEARRWWRFVKVGPECWEWTGATDRDGYPIFDTGIGRYAHRFAYWLFNGPLDSGLELDHTCRNRACVNPLHLEQVTHAENMKRAMPDECRHGHPLSGPNLTIYTEPGGRVRRRCKKCSAAATRRYQQRKKEQA